MDMNCWLPPYILGSNGAEVGAGPHTYTGVFVCKYIESLYVWIIPGKAPPLLMVRLISYL